MIHEVYSYGPESVDDFWNMIWGYEPDYVAIRDMMVSETSSRPSCPHSAMRIRQVFSKIDGGPEFIRKHEANWGSLNDNWSLIHFLLKYRYISNWDREVNENYLPISVEKLLNIIPSNFDIHYSDHYTLPYIKGEVWKDFYIQLQDSTHFKLILRRVKNAPRKIFGDK